MKNIEPKTLKGFRDFLPAEARKRQYVITTLKQVFERYGFEPLETPVLEYEEILTGKYGEEGDQLMYRFEDNGKRRVAMRYDQTVPTARVVAQYENQLVFPFKRYQIQPVWRAENTQKGRYREFLQCDADIVGSNSWLADAEILTVATESLKKLGFTGITVTVNHRKVFENLSKETITIIDKIKKIGEEGVYNELVNKKIVRDISEGKALLTQLKNAAAKIADNEFSFIAEHFPLSQQVLFTISNDPTLARGLDYYTGMIFEIEIQGYNVGSVCGGGRYDDLIGMFAGRQIPAVGFAFGFDRIIEAMDELQLFPAHVALSSAQVLVTIFSETLQKKSLEMCSQLRQNNINTEIYLGEIKEKNPLEKQLKYADAKNIPYVLILGPKEIEKNIVMLRNMETREQKEYNLADLIQHLI